MTEANSVYCLCRKPYDSDSEACPFMIQCDACKEWFHGYCIEVSEEDAEFIEKYHCPSCTATAGPSIKKEDKEDTEAMSVSAKRTTALIRRLKLKQYPADSESPLVRLKGSELTIEHFAKNGFRRPIIIDQKDELGMKVPSSTILLEEIQQLVGGSTTMLDAIDVLEQVNIKMSFAEFIRYWYSATRGGKIYNVISLEVSATPLSDLIEAPRVVRQMSWVDLYWPADRLDKVLRRVSHNSGDVSSKGDEKKPNTLVDPVAQAANAEVTSIEAAEEARHFVVYDEDSITEDDDETEAVRLSVDDPNYAILVTANSLSPKQEGNAKEESDEDDKPILAKPRVTKYCLMSAKGSFTDFHVDFGGTSVWYHVLRGEKVFYLIPPSKHSTRMYERWMCTEPNPTQRDIFLCDQVHACYRVVLKQGQTVLLPSGWIHAVYTPADSLVFGGNFLHFFSAARQIRVYEMEKRLHTPAKFMFPNFQTAHWYAASALREQLFDRISVRESVADHLVDAARTVCEALRSWTNTKQAVKLNRQFIPESIDYRDVLTELEHLITQAERGFKSGAAVNKQGHPLNQVVTRARKKSSKSKADDDEASLSLTSDDDSDTSSIIAKRRRRAPTAAARGKQKPKTLQESTCRTSVATSSPKISSASDSTQRHVLPGSVKHAAPITVKTQPDTLPKQTGLSEKRAISSTTVDTKPAKPIVARKLDTWADLFVVRPRTGSAKPEQMKSANTASAGRKPIIIDKYNSFNFEDRDQQQQLKQCALPKLTNNFASSSKRLEDATFSSSSSTARAIKSPQAPTAPSSSNCSVVAFGTRPDSAAGNSAKKAKLLPPSSSASTSGTSTSDTAISRLKTCPGTEATKSGTILPERTSRCAPKCVGEEGMEFTMDHTTHKDTLLSPKSKKDGEKKHQSGDGETATKSMVIKPRDRLATKLIVESDAVVVQSPVKDNESVVWAKRAQTNVNSANTHDESGGWQGSHQ